MVAVGNGNKGQEQKQLPIELIRRVEYVKVEKIWPTIWPCFPLLDLRIEHSDNDPCVRVRKDSADEEMGILIEPAQFPQELIPNLLGGFLMRSSLVDHIPEKGSHLPVLNHHLMVALAPAVITLKVMLNGKSRKLIG